MASKKKQKVTHSQVADYWKIIKPRITLFGLMFALASLEPLANWANNRYQVTIQDIVLPLILSAITGLIITIIFWRGYSRDKFSGLIGGSLSILVLTQGFSSRFSDIRPFLDSLNPLPALGDYSSMVGALLFIIVAILLARWAGILIGRWIVQDKRLQAVDLAGAVTVIISITFLLVAYPVIKDAATEWSQFFYRPPALTGTAKTTATKPDIYYVVLDRYTSQSVLQNQFNFSNSDFINYLNKSGFNVNPNALDNYPYTTMSISSTLNANYQNDLVQKFSSASLQTLEPYHDAIRYASVIEQMKSLGYTYDQIGSWYEASNQAPLADNNYQPEGQLTVLGHQITLNPFAKDELMASMFYPLIQHGFGKALSYSTISESDATLYKIKTLEQLASQPAGGRFIFAHILVPHDPYYFNADGSLSDNPSVDSVGEPIKQKYVQQVEFINGQMEQLVSQINTATNNQAVIVIQSDEGPYPMELNDNQFNGTIVDGELGTEDMTAWSNQDLRMKYGILAAYHVPQATSEAIQQGGDSVNIFRVILNTYFGDNLPYLPRCYYAYTSGREQSFVYGNINQQLTGQTNPACSEDSSKSP